jgi:hypothetical protein
MVFTTTRRAPHTTRFCSHPSAPARWYFLPAHHPMPRVVRASPTKRTEPFSLFCGLSFQSPVFDCDPLFVRAVPFYVFTFFFPLYLLLNIVPVMPWGKLSWCVVPHQRRFILFLGWSRISAFQPSGRVVNLIMSHVMKMAPFGRRVSSAPFFSLSPRFIFFFYLFFLAWPCLGFRRPVYRLHVSSTNQPR